MSAFVHGVVAGPTLKKLTPAATASRSASAPDGVVPPRGGPFASTIGKTFVPFNSTVPFASTLVTVAPADAAKTSAPTEATAARRIALEIPLTPAMVTTIAMESQEHHVTLIGRVEASFRPDAGQKVRLGLAPDKLHFFDLETGAAIRA